jgi:hypothetical protein
VKKIIEFKYDQLQSERKMVFEQLEKELKTKGSYSQEPSKEHSQSPRSRSPKVEQFAMEKKTVTVSISEEALLRENIKDTRSQRSFAGGSSVAASSRILRRVYEISEHEKANKLELMINGYYREGMQCFNMIRVLKQRVFMILNQTQTNFITFLERPGPLQKKLNDFCENYNKFN